jgi:hypothetical protein
MNHGNQTYIASTAIDNYCYAEDEEIELSSSVVRQQTRKPVREPPIGASTTFKITETSADNISARIPATPVSPKRHYPNGTKIAPPRSDHQNQTTVSSPRTPKKNVTVRSHASEPPGRAVTISPRRQQMCAKNTTPRKTISPTSARRTSVRAVKYVLTPRASTLPHHNMAVIPPMYTPASTARFSDPQKQAPFLATGLVCRKSPTRMDTSPGLKASWIHMPTPYQTPPTGTIVTAGATLLLCGAVTVVLSLYMMSKVREASSHRINPIILHFYETRRMVTAFVAHILKPVCCTPNTVISFISILIISPTLRIDFPNDLYQRSIPSST